MRVIEFFFVITGVMLTLISITSYWPSKDDQSTRHSPSNIPATERAILPPRPLLKSGDADPPIQFRLAFAGPTGMSVTYTTHNAVSAPQYCYFGAVDLNSIANVTWSRTYGTYHFHTAVLTNLKPSTYYSYQCGTARGQSPVYTFKSQVPVGWTGPMKFAVIGDLGVKHGENTLAGLKAGRDKYDWIYHVGDFAYADDWMLKLTTFEQAWTDWHNEVENFTAVNSYMTMPGNHEAACQEALPRLCSGVHYNFTAYRNRFRMPNEESGGTENMWYSFDYGPIHFISISTETDFPNAAEGADSRFHCGPFGNQLAWLDQDLQKATANRKNVPWIIMSGHRPIFWGAETAPELTKAFLPFIEKYNIDMYLSAHKHAYERYFPISPSGKCTQKDYNEPKDCIYIVNGAAGNVEGHESKAKPANYTAYSNYVDYGWGLFEFDNSTHLRWTFYGAGNKVLDTANIIKSQH